MNWRKTELVQNWLFGFLLWAGVLLNVVAVLQRL